MNFKISYHSDQHQILNRAFLYGDAVKVFFYIHQSQWIFAEETYFYLMASMRKMRMNIPLSYTLEYFQQLFQEQVLDRDISEGIIHFVCFRNLENQPLEKSTVHFWFGVEEKKNVLEIQSVYEMDVIKEINVNTNILSNIQVHCPENTYAEIFAKENDLNDVILLNPDKRIARSIYGNLLFLEGNSIKIPKQSEGAYISPLMERLITYIHKNNLAEIIQAELIAFESQKADEILVISDEKGIFSVSKIRNKIFGNQWANQLISAWRESFN